MRLLLVEDDYQLGESLNEALRLENYAVDWERDGALVLPMIKAADYDLMVLDLGLPNMSGLEILDKMRAAGNTLPVLVLTAQDATDKKVQGFDAGADDYLTKPFEMDELLARIRALIRRREDYKQPTLSCGDICLDPNHKTVTYQGEAIDLTAKEYALLEMLIMNAGRFVSKNRILEGLYSWDQDVESNTVEVYISKLRKRFGSDFIETFRGVGYRVGAK